MIARILDLVMLAENFCVDLKKKELLESGILTFGILLLWVKLFGILAVFMNLCGYVGFMVYL